MKERPILFSTPMVQAILAGRKTQTRRIVQPQPTPYDFGVGGVQDAFLAPNTNEGFLSVSVEAVNRGSLGLVRSPFGVPGDRLWVREAWAPFDYALDDYKPSDLPTNAEIVYLADQKQKLSGDRYRPSIHMPRWASRITLAILSVRVERLQDISDDEAVAEGIHGNGISFQNYLLPNAPPNQTARSSFYSLWSTIHKNDGPHGWDANPWVWVIGFISVETPRD